MIKYPLKTTSFAILTYVLASSGQAWSHLGLGEDDAPTDASAAQAAPLGAENPIDVNEDNGVDAPLAVDANPAGMLNGNAPIIHPNMIPMTFDLDVPPPAGPIEGLTLDDYRAIIRNGDHPQLHEVIKYIASRPIIEDRALVHTLLRARFESHIYNERDLAGVAYLRRSEWPDNQILGFELQEKFAPLELPPELQECISRFDQSAIKAALADPSMRDILESYDDPDMLSRHALQNAMRLAYNGAFVQTPNIVLQAHIGLSLDPFKSKGLTMAPHLTDAEIESTLTKFYAHFTLFHVLNVMSELIQHSSDARTIASYESASEQNKPMIAARITLIKQKRPITVTNIGKWLFDHKEPGQTDEEIMRIYEFGDNYISFTGLKLLLERWGYLKTDAKWGIATYFPPELSSEICQRYSIY